MQVKIQVVLKYPRADVLAIKEALAYYCEAYGDIVLVSVEPIEEEQESLWRKGSREQTQKLDRSH